MGDEDLVPRLQQHLESEFGPNPDLASLVQTLLPRRAPFYETNVEVELLDRKVPRGGLRFKYRLTFKAHLARLLFAVSASHAVTESLMASMPLLTEVTTLGDDEDLDDLTRVLLEGDLHAQVFENTARGTARARDIELKQLSEAEVSSLLSESDSTVPSESFRLLAAEELPSNGEAVRVGLTMTRTLPDGLWCLPWLVDRPIFLNSFTLDGRGCARERLRLEVHPFMTSNEQAYVLPLSSNDRIVMHINHWLVAGQGVMMSWRPEGDSDNEPTSLVPI